MIKFRYYIDNQKEQDWLNKLSREGWALKKFFLGFYKFEKCEPGEYEYQIDLMPENVEQQDYYDFMEEAGVALSTTGLFSMSYGASFGMLIGMVVGMCINSQKLSIVDNF